MILSKDIQVRIGQRNIRYWKQYYPAISLWQTINVPVNLLPSGSNDKVLVRCDVCGKEKMLKYLYHHRVESTGIYACTHKCAVVKYEKTCIERFGEKTALLNPEIKGKRKETMIRKYGFEYTWQNKCLKDKVDATVLERYGVKNVTQNIDIFIKQRKTARCIKRYKDTQLYYQGSYEFDFLEKYLKKIEIINGPHIKYVYDNLYHTYFPDFYIPELNLIVEIKSSYTYKCELEINMLKQKISIEKGYNFIFIINKNYEKFEKYLKYLKYEQL